MNASLYAGSQGYVSFIIDGETEQFAAHLVVKRTNMEVGKFSYPARDGYQTLIKIGNNYEGYLTEDMTADIANEMLVVEVKSFINSHAAPIGAANVRRVEDNTLKRLKRVE